MKVRIVDQYPISLSTFVIKGQIIDNKLHSIVFDKDGFVCVKAKPNILIARSLKKINSSFAHARDVAKSILGDNMKKLPIVVSNHFGQPIVLFPLFSPNSKDNIWVVYNSVTNIVNQKTHLDITFKHQYEIDIPVSNQVFNNQYVRASRLFQSIYPHWRTLD